MRQDSKNEDKESNLKISDKRSTVEVLDQCKITDESKREKNALSESRDTVEREQTNEHTYNEKQSVKDSLEKITSINERGKDNLDHAKKSDTRQKSIDGKVNPPSKLELTLEEKRKSAPVRPELTEDWTKPVFNKQSSLEERNRCVLYW